MHAGKRDERKRERDERDERGRERIKCDFDLLDEDGEEDFDF